VARPGLDPAPAAARRGDPPTILCVGSVTPRKDQRTLIAALARVVDRPWRAVVAGADDLDPACAAAVRAAAAPLGGRVRLLGALDDAALDAAYDGADLFALPSRYEGYGMVYAEAMMRALPVVAARNAAAEALIPETAGLLVPPGDDAAMAAALAALLDDPARARAMGDAGRAAALALPGWRETAAAAARALAPLARA
jgi:glycosyltransferase involved in cell wall biosynthesis